MSALPRLKSYSSWSSLSLMAYSRSSSWRARSFFWARTGSSSGGAVTRASSIGASSKAARAAAWESAATPPVAMTFLFHSSTSSWLAGSGEKGSTGAAPEEKSRHSLRYRLDRKLKASWSSRAVFWMSRISLKSTSLPMVACHSAADSASERRTDATSFPISLASLNRSSGPSRKYPTATTTITSADPTPNKPCGPSTMRGVCFLCWTGDGCWLCRRR
mmetsp:Transcript_608/g.1731  ORF Transcript_608/g.1731 Transcript_608/m.1731 type:complete len:218 (+) Transcript_608:1309-1962(+)